MIPALSLVLVLAASFGEMAYGLTEEEKTTILAKHNQYRNEVDPPAANMRSLRWNHWLANTAQTWADQCTFSDNNPSSPRWDVVGQNIAQGVGSSLISLMDSWNNQKDKYDLDTDTCSPARASCNQYIQVVWATTSFLGCGKAQCEGKTYLVCYYGTG
ncbi:venom allergen 5-like [Strongylocentrotus purpuratus]|uniref:SCP domain-containing protein n=1 Tax=Strongylocentrotus purpuratus TaxID=7668 RepID=A0A7M7PDH3_STRPU|nr:venom allergen 5-like [Strongylocentrotus purpuratus]